MLAPGWAQDHRDPGCSARWPWGKDSSSGHPGKCGGQMPWKPGLTSPPQLADLALHWRGGDLASSPSSSFYLSCGIRIRNPEMYGNHNVVAPRPAASPEGSQLEHDWIRPLQVCMTSHFRMGCDPLGGSLGLEKNPQCTAVKALLPEKCIHTHSHSLTQKTNS